MKRARIIVVEDDRVVARDIAAQLERMGHVVLATLPCGEDAVALAMQERPDLVLMDIHLDGRIDGIEAARALREHCRIPVIFLTAYADDQTLERAAGTEASGYLLKPLDESQLRTSIEMALHKHATERKLRESEAHFRSLTDLSSDWRWKQDESLRFIDLSGEVHEPSDEASGLAVGRTLWELADITPLSSSWFEHKAALAARQPFRDFEYRQVGLDGQPRFISISGAPVFNEHGSFGGYQGVARDITERKRLDAEQRSAREMVAMPATGWEQVETLRQDGEFVLSRGVTARDSNPVLVLSAAAAHASPQNIERMRHEYALRDQLDAAWAAKPRALAGHNGRTVLLLDDPGVELLGRCIAQPWEIEAFLRVSIGMLVALGRVHERGLIHKDLKPDHFFVDVASGHAWLTGFGIASRLPRERQAPEPVNTIVGTLAYMAPEQTGRMNRSIDSRSDLYSIGVTLYQMLTARLPFAASEPLEWIHCHIARAPAPIVAGRDEVLGALPAIIMKLLAKTAEDRYQSACGVEADLRRCLGEWKAAARISAFPLGTSDTSDRLLVPEKLYGRHAEIDALLASFDAVVSRGNKELVFISGYSGIGKSSLVNELHKLLVPSRGLFAAAKFDQYKRDIPYATIGQAFRTLIREVLAKSDSEMAEWRAALRNGLGANGQLVMHLIPELEIVIGKQPAVPDLPAAEAQARFLSVFRGFIGAFATKEHPLVLFLDDLQWLDAATLMLLEHLATSPDVRHVLIVGAYRDNEVTPSHPLVRTLDAIRGAGVPMRELTLTPLRPEDVTGLIADALRTDPAHVWPLAQVVHERSLGNPFFAIQFFTELAEDRSLAFDITTRQWVWDVEQIRGKGFANSVVDLMLGKLARLRAPTQNALRQFACLGNAASTQKLAALHGGDEDAVHEALWEAVRSGLVLRTQRGYAFLHDRVQEAAYALWPEHERAAAHLAIGRALLARAMPRDLEDEVFEIVNQFNHALPLIQAPAERERVADLNLVAGRRARTSTAYASARSYFAAGATLLADDGWTRCRDLAFQLERDLGECEFMSGDLTAADERLTALAGLVRARTERASVTWLRVTLYTAMDQSGRAVEVGLGYLKDLGIVWSPRPTAEQVQAEYELLLQQVGDRAIEGLVDLPLMDDPERQATVDVLMAVLPPAVYTNKNLVLLVLCRAANISIEHGNTDASSVAFAYLGMYLGPSFNDYPAGYHFAKLGLDLLEQRGLGRFKARVYMTLGYHVMPWTKHLDEGTFALLRRTFEAATEAGDVNYIAYHWYCLVASQLARGTPLAQVQRDAEAGLAFVKQTKFGLLIDIITAQLALVRSLRGLTPVLGRFDEDGFDEAGFEAHLADNPALAIAAVMYWIRKLEARFLGGDYEAAAEAAAHAEPQVRMTDGHLEIAEFYFYAALARAAQAGSATGDERGLHVQAVADYQKQLDVWAQTCPGNWQARALLVAAERARLDGRDVEAMQLYEQAIDSAHIHGFVNNEAIACETAARFYAMRGFATIADTYCRKARDRHARWGAEAKVRQLDAMTPKLEADATEDRRRRPGGNDDEADLATVVRSSQAVSAETGLEPLMDTLMVTMLQHAGAQRGLLILPHDTGLRIEAQAQTGSDKVEVRLRSAPVTQAELPESVLLYVVRTQDSVLLDDASVPNAYSNDPYIVQNRSRSILCLPLLKQAELIGVLYLENGLAPQVFTPRRTAVLKLLASQAAISLQNARLYAELQQENSDRKQSEDRYALAVEALRTSEERFALAVAGSNEGIFDWDLALDRVYVSRRAQELLGLRPGALWRGRREWRDTLPLHPDDLDVQRRGIKAHVAGQTQTYDVEFRLNQVDGGWRWFRQRGVALRDASGRAHRMVGSIGDITERKAAQEELLRLERRLRQAQQFEAMGTLAGGIAHDFNNILGAILGYGEMVSRDAPQGSRLRRDVDGIMAAGERGRALVDRILAFSRSGVAERIPVHVAGVVREALELVHANLPDYISVETQLQTGHAAMLGDPTQVHQVVMNLVTNAVQAMTDGGTLRVSLDLVLLDAPHLATTATIGAGEYIALTVKDDGAGIESEIIERIFDPFFSTKEVGVGTGIGLSLVRAIVSEIGGAIDVESIAGRGSVFTVYLPRNGDAFDAQESDATDWPRGERQRVIVVDDEGPLVRLAAENLAEWGYVPVAFTSSAAALEAFRAQPELYDAVITDERMPGMAGSALIREIHDIRPAIPTLLVSGYVGADLLLRAKDVGADDVLKKPLSMRQLALSLSRALGQ
jgi:PAS domain S-box-containing protein